MTTAITFPYAPMEARVPGELPPGEGWQFEPKWDGFRCLDGVVLPGGTNGAELAAAAARLSPGLPTILMSGYAKEPLPAGEKLPSHAFLPKPFTPDVLCAKIREVISAQG